MPNNNFHRLMEEKKELEYKLNQVNHALSIQPRIVVNGVGGFTITGSPGDGLDVNIMPDGRVQFTDPSPEVKYQLNHCLTKDQLSRLSILLDTFYGEGA